MKAFVVEDQFCSWLNITFSPATKVALTSPNRERPVYGVNCLPDNCEQLVSGSQTTMSASNPRSSRPFFLSRPASFDVATLIQCDTRSIPAPRAFAPVHTAAREN